MQIGTFRATAEGFAGRLQTLTIDVQLTLVLADQSDAENVPDYRVMIGDGERAREVGAAWMKIGEKAGAYLAVQIDDPSFVQPIRANLFQAGAAKRVLHWNRPTRRDQKG
jgi:uncharacterized protein (DUF736 family)